MKCYSLQEVRSQIDKIDRQIVELIAQRGHYVEQAAAFKKNMEGVEAPARVEEVIRTLTAYAGECGANPKVIENVFRTMIREFILAETEIFRAGNQEM